MRQALLFLVLLIIFSPKNTTCNKINILREKTFSPCKACKVYVDSFKKGMESTSSGKFEGGDAAWEEEKLVSYSQSEVRLTEIQERICSDVEEGKNQCYALHGEYDFLIEEWWFNYQASEEDLFKYLCINHLKLCCPKLHYGQECLQCPGYPDKVCNNNGRCKGAGTRQGNGQCVCNAGYVGESCNQCASMYYEAYKDDKKLLCSKCHLSCADECNNAGPTGCLNCVQGWIMKADKGCVDMNECISSKPACSFSEFCVNTEGSYRCLKCDLSCNGCTGDGPDMCISCASGYVLVDNICIDSTSEERKGYVFLTRYLTYLGLAIATCIIFSRNIVVAAIVGICVAVYITVSEYMLNTPLSLIDSIQQHVPKDLENFNL